MKNSAQVVIIGGGVNGCLLAYHLAKSGLDVVLLEENYLASGATGRSQAGIRQNLIPLFATKQNIKLAKRSVEIFEQLGDRFDRDVEFTQHGSLLLAHNQAEKNLFRQVMARQREQGIQSTWVTNHQIADEIAPCLDVDKAETLGGLYCPSDAQVNPFKLTHTYAEFANREGALIYTGTKAISIEVDHQKVIGVNTSKGRIQAEKVVVAGGAKTRKLAKTAGVTLPTFPERHEIAITEPLAPFLDPIVFSPHHWTIFGQTERGGVIGGWSGVAKKASDYNQEADAKILSAYSRYLALFIPNLRKVNILRFWSGLFDIPIDFTPIVGETWIKNLFVNCGFAGHGITYAPALGELLTELITTGSTSNQDIMDSLSPKRFRSPKKYVEQTLWRFMDRIPDTTWEKMRSPLGKLMLRWGHLISKLM